MKAIWAWIKNAADTPKTSVPGLSMICGGIGLMVKNPAGMLDATGAAVPLTMIFGGIGLLNSADAGDKAMVDKK